MCAILPSLTYLFYSTRLPAVSWEECADTRSSSCKDTLAEREAIKRTEWVGASALAALNLNDVQTFSCDVFETHFYLCF